MYPQGREGYFTLNQRLLTLLHYKWRLAHHFLASFRRQHTKILQHQMEQVFVPLQHLKDMMNYSY